MSQHSESKQQRNPCRLFGLLARASPVGVLFRRGPSHWVRLIKWHTDSDTFEFGQWFHGRIYERRCDLSPNGKLLIYFASKFNKRTLEDLPTSLERLDARISGETVNLDGHYTYAWTAVSKPPWLTALALWPKGDCWHGGGLFESDTALWLNHLPGLDRPHPNHIPKGLHVRANPEAHGEDYPIYSKRLQRDGWRLEQKGECAHSRKNGRVAKLGEVCAKACPSGSFDLLMNLTAVNSKSYGGRSVLEFCMRRSSTGQLIEIGRATWADFDQRGRLVFAKDGSLFVCEETSSGDVALRLIHDFNDDKPMSVPPPAEATVW